MSASETSCPERPTLRQRAIREAVRFGQIFLYLWVVLGIFVTIEELVLREHSTRFAPQGFAIINALVLGKVILIGDDLKLGRRWAHGRPLIVPILFEAFVFTLLLIVFRYVEDIAVGLFAGRTIAQSLPVFGGGGGWGLAVVAVLLFLALIPYFGFANLSRALGPGRLHTFLFHTPAGTP